VVSPLRVLAPFGGPKYTGFVQGISASFFSADATKCPKSGLDFNAVAAGHGFPGSGPVARFFHEHVRKRGRVQPIYV